MTRREAIDKLKHLINSPVGREEIDETCHEVIEYLAAQEPRVMTLEELYEIELDTPAWFEIPFEGQDFGQWVIIRYNRVMYPQNGQQEYFEDGALEGINVKFRPWTSRPTDEQREATPWTKC